MTDHDVTTRPAMAQPPTSHPADSRPTMTRPADSRPAIWRLAAAQPAMTRSATSQPVNSRPAMTRPAAARSATTRPAAPAIALTATLALAAAAWPVAAWHMGGMDMGTATPLGAFPSFLVFWLVMMAAMMLPGAAPAVRTLARSRDAFRAVPLFLTEYLLVWTLAGAAAFALYRPHGTAAAGAITVAAGLYELTPIKKHFRQNCQRGARSGLSYGVCCAGSTIGLMAVLLALGVMSLLWMSVLAALVLVQKLAPPKPAFDIPLALAIVGFGAWLLLAPAL